VGVFYFSPSTPASSFNWFNLLFTASLKHLAHNLQLLPVGIKYFPQEMQGRRSFGRLEFLIFVIVRTFKSKK